MNLQFYFFQLFDQTPSCCTSNWRGFFSVFFSWKEEKAWLPAFAGNGQRSRHDEWSRLPILSLDPQLAGSSHGCDQKRPRHQVSNRHFPRSSSALHQLIHARYHSEFREQIVLPSILDFDFLHRFLRQESLLSFCVLWNGYLMLFNLSTRIELPQYLMTHRLVPCLSHRTVRPKIHLFFSVL